jgi:hypothetical protein
MRKSKTVCSALVKLNYKLVHKVVSHDLGAARQHILQRRARLIMPDPSAVAADPGQHAPAVVDESFRSFKADSQHSLPQ